MGSPRKLVGRVLRSRIVALPGNDHCPVRPPDDERLVSLGVAWRRQQEDACQYFDPAFHLLEVIALKQLGESVIRCLASRIEFCRLDNYRYPAQCRVTAAVIEMQVTIGGQHEIADLRADGRERLGEPGSARPVVGVHLGMGSQARVE